MNWLKNEKVKMMIIIAAILFYLFTLFFLKDILVIHKYENYIAMHTVLELISISISFIIAIQSWIVFTYKHSNDRLLYFSGFTIVGILDLFHTLTYYGMPGNVFLESSANNATWFWVLARLIQALFIFYILHTKTKIVPDAKKWGSFFHTFADIFIILWAVSHFQDILPLLVIEGKGTTILKNTLEYIISFILLLSIIRLLNMYRKTKKSILFDFIVAITFLLLSELFFTLYRSVYDAFNLIGHLYKILGFAFFMRVLYILTVKEPYETLIATQKKLEQNEHRFKTITASLGEGIFVMDRTLNLSFINREGERMLGYKAAEVIGKNIHNLIHGSKEGGILPTSECPVCNSFQTKKKIRIEDDIFIHKSGRTFPVSYVVTPLFEKDEMIGSIVVFQDISKQKEYIQKIEFQAYHNVLTNLPNRFYFVEQLKEKISRADLIKKFAVVLIDIDDFKNINDSYGHNVGDKILIEISKILKTIGNHTFVAHSSGDEFAIIMDGNKQEVKMQVEKLIDHFHQPIIIGHNEIFISISIGISTFPYDGVDCEKLIQVTDIALSEAKRLGKNQYVFYNDELEYRRIRKIWIEQHLYKAFMNNEITVNYQPIVDPKTKSTIGLEALARWYHPTEGSIPPQEFIDVAESNGLIIPMGTYIIQTACRDLAEIHKKGFKHLYVSINLSLKQLKHPDFINTLEDIIQSYKLDPNLIQLEITETMTLQEDSDLINSITKLKKEGFRIAIDDFGKGFSSIGYLKHISVDTLKIDKSYVFHLMSDKKIVQITKAIITMAELLDLNIVAEGVETKEQLAFLNQYANIFAQGYYFSRPVPLDQCIGNLETT